MRRVLAAMLSKNAHLVKHAPEGVVSLFGKTRRARASSRPGVSRRSGPSLAWGRYQL